MAFPARTRTRSRTPRSSRRTHRTASRASTSCAPCAALIPACRAASTCTWAAAGSSGSCTRRRCSTGPRRREDRMAEVHNLREVGTQIERLLAELGADADPSVQRRAEELVRLLVDFYGAALARVVELADPDLVGRLADDELVASLLIVHDLHPLDTRGRVEAALERVRPYLGSHAGGVELRGIDDRGVVHLALEGTCNGCQSSTLTVRLS